MVGTVILRKQAQFTAIDVEFADKHFHRNLTINDDFRCSMASLSYSGLVLASKGDYDQDKYDEDDDVSMDDAGKVDKRGSYLYFKPLNEWRRDLKDWNFKMNYGESILCIAQGTGWVAAFTSAGYIRIFSNDGVQKFVLHQSSQVVTMTGYENMLVIIYHGGLPVYDSQQLKFKVIDCGISNSNQ